MVRRPASWGRSALAVSLLAASFMWFVGVGTPLAAAPPPNQSGVVPFNPPRTIQRNGQSVSVRTIRTTRTADGREAVADRIIVGFRAGVSDTDKNAVHTSVASKGKTSAAPLTSVGPNATYVDVTGAASLDTV